MSWKRERDSLITQTMAFVQSVTGRKDEGGRERTQSAPPAVELTVMEALEQELSPPKVKPSLLEPVRVAAPLPSHVPAADLTRSRAQGEMVNEIRARVASFRAHQERFNREREEYFTSTLARLRQAIKDVPPPRHR
jgi:hypothetical protein